MADDLGYSDLGCYGGEISTPNIDKMAADGLRFTQFYNTGRCCPTRASLMTGLYPHNAGLGHMIGKNRNGLYFGELSHNAVTIAEALKLGGYKTYLSGKWHLTAWPNPKDIDKANWPNKRGFDEFYGTIASIRNALEEKGLSDNTVIILMGDNGYFMGERQFAGKWLMYENALRVPLIIYDPRVQKHNDVADFGLNIDIAPTILEYAGVEIPNSYQGISLVNYVNGNKPKKSRNSFLCEHLWDFERIPASEGIRSEEWKYFRYVDYPEHEELYHLLNDSNEISNLALEKKYSSKLNEMRKDFERIIFDLMSDQESH